MHPKRVFAGAVGFLVLAAACTAAKAAIIYVDDDAPPGGNGLSWPTAYTHLQDALTAAQPSDEIRVAQGTYYPDRDTAHPTGTGDCGASFFLGNSVTISGGYVGLSGPDPDARDVALYASILSGDIGVPVNNGDNSYHVVLGFGTASLDGFTVTGGNARESFPSYYGGGVFCYYSSPTLANCTIMGNAAEMGGAGVGCYSSNPTLTNCVIKDNTASWRGGGMYCNSSSPTLIDCRIQANSALMYDGGGVHCYGSSPTLTNCSITGNYAPSGGGVECSTYSSPTLTDCTISDNHSFAGAGVECSHFSNPALANCTISGNTATAPANGSYNRISLMAG